MDVKVWYSRLDLNDEDSDLNKDEDKNETDVSKERSILGNEKLMRIYMWYTSLPEIINSQSALPQLEIIFNELNEKIKEKELKQSGYTVERISEIRLNIFEYISISGAGMIKLPFNSKSLILENEMNSNNCFFNAILNSLNCIEEVDEMKIKGIKEIKKENQNPISIDVIKRINKDKDFDLRINVFELNKKREISQIILNHLYWKPTSIPYEDDNGERKLIHYTNLFICLEDEFYKSLQNSSTSSSSSIEEKSSNKESLNSSSSKSVETDSFMNHYILCTDVSTFIKGWNNKHKCFACLNCLLGFRENETLLKHQVKCLNNSAAENIFPSEDYTTFNKFNFKNKVPFVMYADFESYNLKLDKDKNKNELSGAYLIQKPFCYGIYIKSLHEEIFKSKYIKYIGGDASKRFVETIKNLEKTFSRILQKNIPFNGFVPHERGNQCEYCEKEFEEEKFVLDHNHLTGEFRAWACNSCNVKAQDNFIPMYFHNASKYDIHLFFKDLYEDEDIKKLKHKVLPHNDETYISQQIGCIRILDSLRMLSGSLADLGSKLSKFTHLNLYGHALDGKPKKGIYPYEYILGNTYSDIEKIMKEEKLPAIEKFYSSLSQKGITEKEYEEAQKNWKDLKCETIEEYTMKYLQIDVLLLTDIFECFREKCLDIYGIDPCYCYSIPGYTWIAGLKYTNVELKNWKAKTYDQLLFIEHGIRGGVSSPLGNRVVTCRNKKITPDFQQTNPDELENYLLVFDANSLYASSMVAELPSGEMSWVDDNEYERTLEGPTHPGYIYEVDLKYPDEIKERTRYYPLCPEKTLPLLQMFTEYQKSIQPKSYKPTPKLLMAQTDKKNYVVEGRCLDWYVDNGMIIEKIHKKLKYDKSTWLKSYIENNIELRTAAKASGDKTGDNLFKLMNNSYFGKTLENIRNRQNIEIVYANKRFKQMVGKPTFKKFKKFTENVMAVHFMPNRIKHDKYNYIGFLILEISKLIMYKFVYDCVDKHMRDENGKPFWKIHYTDTDSIYLELTIPKNSSIEKETAKFSEWIHPTDLFKFKDELGDNTYIESAVFLSSKCYSYKTVDISKNEHKKTDKVKFKGISYSSQQKIKYEEYENYILGNRNDQITQNNSVRNIRMGVSNHEIYIVDQLKEKFNMFQDKNIILEGGIETRPFGFQFKQ